MTMMQWFWLWFYTFSASICYHYYQHHYHRRKCRACFRMYPHAWTEHGVWEEHYADGTVRKYKFTLIEETKAGDAP